MKLTIPFTYSAFVIPPRCRKPRDEAWEGSMTVTIRETTAAEAPVAIRWHSKGFATKKGHTRMVPTTTEYRWFKKGLYRLADVSYSNRTPFPVQTLEQFSKDPLRDLHATRGHGALDQVRQKIKEWAKGILFVDGVRYELAGEPRYVVMTFGLGYNHGIGWGTSLCADDSYNQNIGRDRYFRIDQFEAAVAEATRIAAARGDTKALPLVKTQDPDRFDILIPESVRLKPHKEHGKGCAFINQCEALIEGSGSALAAGLLVIASTK